MNEIALEPNKTFGLVGHAAAEKLLHNSWQSGRMPHSWLISGERGVGKATLAYKFARAVLAADKHPQDHSHDPSVNLEIEEDHPVFRQIAAGSHPDLCVIKREIDEKTGKTRNRIIVEDARKLKTFFSHTSVDGGWRVAIVDAADELNTSAANSLLKIIEEPPDRALIFILAHKPGMVISTIRSRCHKLRLNRLNNTEVSQVVLKNWPELTAEATDALVSMSEGSPGRAIALGEVDGFGIYSTLVEVMSQVPNIKVELIHKFADQLSARRTINSFDLLIELPCWWLSRMIRWQAEGETHSLNISSEEIDIFSHLLSTRSLHQWILIWDKLASIASRGVTRGLDPRTVSINLLTGLNAATR